MVTNMIRKVKISDLDICADLIRQSFLPIAEKFNITKENSPNYVAFSTDCNKLKNQYDNGREMFVYTDNDKIIGYFSLQITDDECELNNLCVLPEYQHKGIGKELLSYAILLARQHNISKMKLSIVEENIKLKNWYSSFGFVHTHTMKYEFFSFTCGYMEMELHEYNKKI